jgi:hypothetical protein
MKKLIFIVGLILAFVSSQAQIAKTIVLDANPNNSKYTYYEFPITASDYMTGYVNTTATFTVDINKEVPCEVVWYLDLDSVKMTGTDSLNVDVKHNYKIFADESYTTLKTVAVDLDGAGDYGASIKDSSYLYPIGAGAAGKNIALAKVEFGRYHQLAISHTTGAGVGKLGDRIKIVKVACKVYLRK